MERVIGDVSNGNGPTLFSVGGIHGTEPAGTHALDRVVQRLGENPEILRGRLLAVRGNLQALEAGRRYLDRDLNRMWDGPPPIDARDYTEMLALRSLLETTSRESKGTFRVLDLHTTSGPTMPFFWLIPAPGVREALEEFPVPAVYDPMNRMTSTLAHYVARSGHSVLLAEGGQHADPAAVDNLEAVLWMVLVQMGCLDRNAPEFARSLGVVRAATDGERALYHIVGKHTVLDDDDFRMRPGYRSFQPVREGEYVADDQNGPIRASVSGRILMPLYTPPCDDGFLIVRESGEWPD
jgi:succinylglutamate desuccinylase